MKNTLSFIGIVALSLLAPFLFALSLVLVAADIIHGLVTKK
jgi:hypothetical protein